MSDPTMSNAADTITFELCEEIIACFGIDAKPVNLSEIRKYAYQIWLQGRVDMGLEILDGIKQIPRPAKFRKPTRAEMDLAGSKI